MDLIIQDFEEEINIDWQRTVATLLVNLEQAMQKGLLKYHSSGVAVCTRQMLSLAGLAADIKKTAKAILILKKTAIVTPNKAE